MDPEILKFDPKAGDPETLAIGLRRVLAPNPSPMTFRGTNTYLVGERELAVIDPGPDSDSHLEALLAALTPGQSISHIVVTHAHIDHSPLAAQLAKRTGAKIWAFGDASAGRSPVMQDLASQGLAGGGEGVDAAFQPDQIVGHGDQISGDGWTLDAIHTPGHFGNHLAFGWNDVCFTGDHVMGWASSLVSPPDGDLTDFMASSGQRMENLSRRPRCPNHNPRCAAGLVNRAPFRPRSRNSSGPFCWPVTRLRYCLPHLYRNSNSPNGSRHSQCFCAPC